MGSTWSQKDEDTSRGAISPPLRHSLAVKPSNPGVPRSDSFLVALPLWWPFSQGIGDLVRISHLYDFPSGRNALRPHAGKLAD